MNKKGFTVLELIIAMSLLAIILSASTTLFYIAIKNYGSQTQKSINQREINFTADRISVEIKKAINVPPNYEIATDNIVVCDNDTLILSLPAVDSSGDFIYNSDLIQTDTVIYQRVNNELRRRIFSTSPSMLAPKNNTEVILLNNVTGLEFTYSPVNGPRQVIMHLETSNEITGRVINTQADLIANLRNQ